MELVAPDVKYKSSFLEGLQEYQSIDQDDRKQYYALNPEQLENDFESYIKKLENESQGIGLPEGYVPQTTFWLVDKNEFIGTVSIRHRLTEHLLKEGGHIGYDIRPSKRKLGYGKKILEHSLPKAKELGIAKALVTCNETNIGSKKIIETNGGVFENSIDMGQGKPRKLRYWITL